MLTTCEIARAPIALALFQGVQRAPPLCAAAQLATGFHHIPCRRVRPACGCKHPHSSGTCIIFFARGGQLPADCTPSPTHRRPFGWAPRKLYNWQQLRRPVYTDFETDRTRGSHRGYQAVSIPGRGLQETEQAGEVSMGEDYYTILGLPRDARDDQILGAYEEKTAQVSTFEVRSLEHGRYSHCRQALRMAPARCR